MPRLQVEFNKPWLENDTDVDSYFTLLAQKLAEVKESMQKEIAAGKRVKL